MVFGSDKSAKEAMEKLPKTEIHGLNPIVTYCNKQNLNYFEQAAGGSSNNNNNNNGNKPKSGEIFFQKLPIIADFCGQIVDNYRFVDRLVMIDYFDFAPI